MIFQNHARVQDRTMNFSITEHKKFTAMVSDTILQLNSKKLLFVEFWCSTRRNYLKRLLKYFHFQPHIYVTFFIHFNQNNILQQTNIRSRCESSAVLSQILKKFARVKNNASFSVHSCFGKQLLFRKKNVLLLLTCNGLLLLFSDN